MLKALKTLTFVLLAVITGLAVAVYRIANFEHSDAFFKNGCWMGSTNMPLGKDNLLTTQITLFGMFALPGKEAVYLFCRRDKDGERLNSENDYEIRGNINQVNAPYWSITMYGRDLFLVPNAADRYSFNKPSLQCDSAGNYVIVISHTPKPGNWLPSPDHARFNLLLRIYRGNQSYLNSLQTTPLPQIVKLPL